MSAAVLPVSVPVSGSSHDATAVDAVDVDDALSTRHLSQLKDLFKQTCHQYVQIKKQSSPSLSKHDLSLLKTQCNHMLRSVFKRAQRTIHVKPEQFHVPSSSTSSASSSSSSSSSSLPLQSTVRFDDRAARTALASLTDMMETMPQQITHLIQQIYQDIIPAEHMEEQQSPSFPSPLPLLSASEQRRLAAQRANLASELAAIERLLIQTQTQTTSLRKFLDNTKRKGPSTVETILAQHDHGNNQTDTDKHTNNNKNSSSSSSSTSAPSASSSAMSRLAARSRNQERPY